MNQTDLGRFHENLRFLAIKKPELSPVGLETHNAFSLDP